MTTDYSNRPCPECGGNDRFYYIAAPQNGGKPYWRCRQCNHTTGDSSAAAITTVDTKPRTAAEITEAQYAYTVVAQRCMDALWSTDGANALAYLRGRGLTDATIRAARLGWCGDGTKLLVDLFYHDRRAYDAAMSAGLSKHQGVPRKVLDRAITIPYFVDDTCVLLRSRALHPQPGQPKYISPAGPLYAGGTPFWYGHRHIAAASSIIVTEGEFKALVAWQEWRAGRVAIPTIASCGVSYLPWPMIQALRGKTVYLAYDSEDPHTGEILSPADQAIRTNGAKLRRAGITVKVITLPRRVDVPKVDLDSYILANR